MAEIIRKHGISRNTYFTWKSKYAGARLSEPKRLPELEAENTKLNRVYDELALEMRRPRTSRAESVTPSAKRQPIAQLVTEHRMWVVRACRVVRLTAAAWYRPPRQALTCDAAVVEALTYLVAQSSNWGFWTSYDPLRLLGQPWNHKRVHRMYCALRLNRARRTRQVFFSLVSRGISNYTRIGTLPTAPPYRCGGT